MVVGYALRVVLWRPLAVRGDVPSDGFTRIAGVVHVHTTNSDGAGTPEEVVAEARAAGLGFVVLTDHNNLDAKPIEGYHDGLLVLVGTEISTTVGHILGLGIPDPGFRFSGDGRDALEDLRDLGGAAFAAHPLSPRPDFRFTGWDLPGGWGLELLNGDSQWREASWGRLLKTAALYPLNPRYALLGSLSPPTGTLARWDSLLGERDAVGLAGADAHGRVLLGKNLAVRFPSYAALFGLAKNHVLLRAPLTRDAAADGHAIVDALARGRSYLALDALASADGFYFVAEGGGGRFTMGDVAPALSGLRLRAGGRAPTETRLTLLKDGRRVAEAQERLEAGVSGSGVYRVEARVPGWDLPWVISNPICVFESGAADQRARRAAWPLQPRPPAPAVVLDAFDVAGAFHPELDPSSSVTFSLDPEAPAEGRASGRMEFHMGPGPGPTWCALMSRESQDFSRRQGLVFWLKGNAAHRLWVQVRDENPASADEGTEWWFASVRTSPEWRRVVLPFAQMRSLNKKTDGRLDLDKVRGMGFVLDLGAAKPGARGTIWLDELAVY